MSAKKDPEIIEQACKDIERLSSEGWSQVGIARHFKISKPVLKRWIEEFPDFEEAFDRGKEVERQRLHAAVYRSAMENKGANVNAFFLLKARHGYVEANQNSVNVNIGTEITTNVLMVKDHGTDEEWAAKAAEQQRKLIEGNFEEIKQAVEAAPKFAPSYSGPEIIEPVAFDYVPETPQVSPVHGSWMPPAPSWGAPAPSWSGTIDIEDENPRTGDPAPAFVPEWRPKS